MQAVSTTAPPTLPLIRAPVTSMLLNPVTISLDFILLELSAAFNKWITPCSFRGFLPSASRTLCPPGHPHNSLGAPHLCPVLFDTHLSNIMGKHLRTHHLVLFSPLSTLTPSVISSGLVGFKYHPHADDSQIYISSQTLL